MDPGGQEIFQYPSSGLIIPSPTVGTDGLVYIGSDDQFVHAIGPDPFGILPRQAPRLDSLSPPAVVQGESVEVILRGKDLPEGLLLDLGPGVEVEATELLSSERMRLTLRAVPGAPLGMRDVLGIREEGLVSTRVQGLEVKFDCRRSDITGDGRVDGLDLASLAARFGSSTEAGLASDLDGNGQVDGTDLSLLASRFGRAAGPCP